ncbi:hypothetical protein [Vannielia litorea]|uniref:hypothetical protein n=1 Tax=Vannielia litorea TaxID=1217970 RepID=UPI001BCC5F8B|nr:hypothetical protein [Vannielia litorea]MBS8228176.1 hypothetical protein [Vannielia litorea]
MHERGSISPRQACTEADVAEVLEMGRAVALSIEAKAYAGFAVVLPPDDALTHAKLIRMGVDAEENMRAAREKMAEEIIADNGLRLAVARAVAEMRKAIAEERSATVMTWFFCAMWSVALADAGRAAAALIRGLF